ncbi:MAG TPA: hypothetical protein PLO50_00925 [Nitrospira sp.]|nr:hypothetical protein [Nitrospira sp.]
MNDRNVTIARDLKEGKFIYHFYDDLVLRFVWSNSYRIKPSVIEDWIVLGQVPETATCINTTTTV